MLPVDVLRVILSFMSSTTSSLVCRQWNHQWWTSQTSLNLPLDAFCYLVEKKNIDFHVTKLSIHAHANELSVSVPQWTARFPMIRELALYLPGEPTSRGHVVFELIRRLAPSLHVLSLPIYLVPSLPHLPRIVALVLDDWSEYNPNMSSTDLSIVSVGAFHTLRSLSVLRAARELKRGDVEVPALLNFPCIESVDLRLVELTFHFRKETKPNLVRILAMQFPRLVSLHGVSFCEEDFGDIIRFWEVLSEREQGILLNSMNHGKNFVAYFSATHPNMAATALLPIVGTIPQCFQVLAEAMISSQTAELLATFLIATPSLHDNKSIFSILWTYIPSFRVDFDIVERMLRLVSPRNDSVYQEVFMRVRLAIEDAERSRVENITLTFAASGLLQFNNPDFSPILAFLIIYHTALFDRLAVQGYISRGKSSIAKAIFRSIERLLGKWKSESRYVAPQCWSGIIKRLVFLGLNVLEMDPSLGTVLSLSDEVYNNYPNVLLELIRAGANPKCINEGGSSLLQAMNKCMAFLQQDGLLTLYYVPKCYQQTVAAVKLDVLRLCLEHGAIPV